MHKETRRLRNSLLEVIVRSRAYIKVRQLTPQGPGHSAGPRFVLTYGADLTPTGTARHTATSFCMTVRSDGSWWPSRRWREQAQPGHP